MTYSSQLLDCRVCHAPFIHGPELVHFAQLRHRVFVEGMGWDVPAVAEMEQDYYDIGKATYVIATRSGTSEVVAGLRLRPTEEHCPSYGGPGLYSYMIRDAQRGLLPSIPMNLMDDTAPIDASIWEATRLVSIGGADATRLVLDKAMAFLSSVGCRKALFLTRAHVERVARRWGYEMQPEGPKVQIDGAAHRVFACDVQPCLREVCRSSAPEIVA
ncbi:acyl-homoserine-lactone synthase [Gymnodinialimonas sp. 2305UL16-5]